MQRHGTYRISTHSPESGQTADINRLLVKGRPMLQKLFRLAVPRWTEARLSVVQKVYLAVLDPGRNHESALTVPGPDGARIPLIAIDEAGLSNLRKYAQDAAVETGKTVSIISFTDRQIHERLPSVYNRRSS